MNVEVVYSNRMKTYARDVEGAWWWRWTSELPERWRPYEGAAFRAPDGTWIGDRRPQRKEIMVATLEEEQTKEPEPAREDFQPGEVISGIANEEIDAILAQRSAQLALPGFEHDPDELELAFTGTIKLNRKDPADVDLIRRLKLFREVALEVTGFVSGRAEKGKVDEDGNTATLRTAVTVTGVDVR